MWKGRREGGREGGRKGGLPEDLSTFIVAVVRGIRSETWGGREGGRKGGKGGKERISKRRK